MKADAYLNGDAGTMNPVEHGEVFVTSDGLETDQDLGHYERFIGEDTTAHNYLTMGSVLREIMDEERSHAFGGKTLEMVPHVPEAVIRRVEACGKHHEADFVICEFGGTVGEYQIQVFLEAARMMTKKHPGRVAHVHVAYLPYIESLGEMKSKPVQLSIRQLYDAGIQPDFLVLRSAAKYVVDGVRKEKIAANTHLREDEIILAPDVKTIYQVPLLFEEQKFAQKLLKRLGVTVIARPKLANWKKRVNLLLNGEGAAVRIGIVAKYLGSGDYQLPDSYVSVIEALKHSETHTGVRVLVEWIDAEGIEQDPESFETTMKYCDGVIIPQGWGSRGADGKIRAIRYAREKKLPYLGLCYGFQMAVVEYAQNVLALAGANSTEIDPKTPHPVVIQRFSSTDIRGALRKGNVSVAFGSGTRLQEIYIEGEVVQERYRHRYQLNPEYAPKLIEGGLTISAMAKDNGRDTYDAVELDPSVHPFFVGVQYHPEYKSQFEAAHPLFNAFLDAVRNHKDQE
jgi:CTP synthase